MDIMVLIEALITLITLGNFETAWFPKWVGCHLRNVKWDNPVEYDAAVELLAEALQISCEETENIIYEYACGKCRM